MSIQVGCDEYLNCILLSGLEPAHNIAPLFKCHKWSVGFLGITTTDQHSTGDALFLAKVLDVANIVSLTSEKHHLSYNRIQIRTSEPLCLVSKGARMTSIDCDQTLCFCFKVSEACFVLSFSSRVGLLWNHQSIDMREMNNWDK